jgi:hypothetical protein
MPTTASASACDLCYGRDGFREMKLLTCPDCGVAFHCECYGVDADSVVQVNNHNQEYPCGACRSVGANFTGRDHTGREHVINQTERPTECSLCSVDEGISLPHPMHPLYDNHGASGQQIVLPPDKKSGKPYRLAWVHTLCAMSITSHSSTGGCVYGCDAAGKYKDTAVEQEGDDKNKQVNPDASKRDQSVHHFVFCHKEKKDDPDSLWTQTIRERQVFKCTLCGANDRNSDGANGADANVSYRIPVQCSANDPAEFPKFKGAHNGLRGGPCFVPVHVGCAQWHKNDAGQYPSVTRVYFFPGNAANTSDVCAPPVINIFCDLHARDLQVAKTTASTITRNPRKARAQAMGAVEDKEIGNKPREKVAGRAASAKSPPSVPTKVASKGVPPARKMPATKKTANNKRAGDTTDQHALGPEDNELCRKMVQDLVTHYRPLKNNKQRNRVRVARECYWKRQSNLSSDEFKVMWGTVKERVTQKLATEETMIAVPTTEVPTSDAPPRKRNSSKISKAAAVDYAGGLEQHRELGDAMYRNAVIAMENIDIVDGAAVKAKMSESRKRSKKSAKGLTLETFKELWSRVKNAVADECGFRYAKSADISGGSKDGAAAKAGVSMGPEDVVERNDTQEEQVAQGGLQSEGTEVKPTEVSNAPGSEITEGKIAEPSNAPKKRRLGGVSESKLQQYDTNQKEQWYNEMVTGIQEVIMKPKAVEAPGSLESILAEHKKRWMKQLGIRNAEFRAIWERVTQKTRTFKATPMPTTKKDWSFLVVGKNYNPDGIDFETWDTYEEIASDPEE